MNIRERIHIAVDRLSDEQLNSLTLFLNSLNEIEDVPNEETVEALREADRIAHDPSVKGFTDLDEMFKELLEE